MSLLDLVDFWSCLKFLQLNCSLMLVPYYSFEACFVAMSLLLTSLQLTICTVWAKFKNWLFIRNKTKFKDSVVALPQWVISCDLIHLISVESTLILSYLTIFFWGEYSQFMKVSSFLVIYVITKPLIRREFWRGLWQPKSFSQNLVLFPFLIL